MKKLLAINTKSNGWIKANHKYEKGKELVFSLNLDNTSRLVQLLKDKIMETIYILFCGKKLISIHKNKQKAIDKMAYYKENDIELYCKSDDYEIVENYLED